MLSDVTRKLKSLDVFNALSDRDLKEISPHFEIIHLRHREVLFVEDAPIQDLYLVLYGSFKIQKKVSNSTPVIFNFLGRGEFLGIAMADIAQPRYPATAIANEDSAILRFSRDFFLSILVQVHGVREVVKRQVSERFLELQNDRCMEKGRMPQRIADLLLRLWERQGESSGSQIVIPITRKDIAQRLGTHTETVIRVLSAWGKKGWIQTTDRRIDLLDIQKLQEIRHERSSEQSQRAAPEDSDDVG
ncbi:Crp/Fnr family transcriptional regulator [Bdellovibrio sp.]|uniref:Crp/Fnr family transcriptional regulator n=1 Tax=Bdellovibrio sp. TaxID=28201 RepID=UPI0039E473EC